MGKRKSELPSQSQATEAEALKRKQEAEAEQERQRGLKAFKECLEEDVLHMTDSEFFRRRFPEQPP